jgi:hemerythrin-like domain-containing protein
VAKDYIQFQRTHIEKEAALLYPLARREVTAADVLRLASDSARFDRSSHRASQAWLTELGESLALQRAV